MLGRLREFNSSRLAGEVFPEGDCSSFCCSPTASRCRTFVLAFSSVSSASCWSCCDSPASLMPTTVANHFIAEGAVVAGICECAIMYCSAVSPSCWLRLLKRARSNITLRRTSSSFLTTASYRLRSSSVMPVDAKTAFASSPMQ